MWNRGIIAVVAQDDQGEWRELLGRKEIKQACMEENKACFSQSMLAGTPFTCQPLLGDFGYLAVGEKESFKRQV